MIKNLQVQNFKLLKFCVIIPAKLDDFKFYCLVKLLLLISLVCMILITVLKRKSVLLIRYTWLNLYNWYMMHGNIFFKKNNNYFKVDRSFNLKCGQNYFVFFKKGVKLFC